MNWKANFPKENRHFETENGVLYNAETIETMSKFPENSIDAIITDLPYGITNCSWDSVIPFEDMWKQLKRIRKDRTPIVLFGSEPFSSYLRISNIKEFKYDWIWEKHKPSNFALAKKQPMKYHEIISVFYKKQCIYNPQMIERKSNRVRESLSKNYVGVSVNYGELNSLKTIFKSFNRYDPDLKLPSSIIRINAVQSNSKEKVKHPTQKPIMLLEYLIKTYTNENDLVLDFTCGSGTTLIAAEKLNRRWIGIELSTEYCKTAKQRLENNKQYVIKF